ncbi:T9SS type A sorting domain-containing protein [Psychroserpens sp. NJDZ02]|uniref:T9SS type A sorting domain-containing protein n=1 Tax=Psychroserpens sp. NJDZ02 TaxID=2570561 RepID=UPI0010A7D56E|nr:T9SS type A sorting domain-containing protein [Psychroserpens sp. NJDZ02]QCE42229.1 T9SS type A sorting domain-containing protein [Psychroserpens sp. NJDZ02]
MMKKLLFTLLLLVTLSMSVQSQSVANNLNGTTIEDELTAMKVYPNPASTTLNIEFSAAVKGGVILEVYNVLGKRVLLKTMTQLRTRLSIAEWNDGVYLLKMSPVNGGKSVTKRLVKI